MFGKMNFMGAAPVSIEKVKVSGAPGMLRRFAPMIETDQQGGAVDNGDMQQQVVQLVQAAMQGDQQAQQQVQQIMQAAQQGDKQAMQIAQMIQQVAQAMQQQGGGQAVSQKYGGRLAYIHQLRTGVATDEMVEYEKCGGKIKKKVVKKQCGGGKSAMGGGQRWVKKRYFGGSL